MTKQLHISLLFCFISFSMLYSQNSEFKINKEYQRIENLKTLMIDSLTHKKGVDFNNGSYVDEKKYKIFKNKKKLVKIEYEEIVNGSRKWNEKTTIYLKNDIPFYITKNINGIMILYTDKGEKSKPYKRTEEIYVYEWNNEKIKRVYNGYEEKNQMKICKICYEKLIEEVKLRFYSKNNTNN
ncbi:hypothetical protein [Amniculibacterium aquaticum]|uniref:hypothetical protein n=1 Tax=Amniculibacterium aquaticum TaxID=2479858 RepID=UPI000F594527|nr:hypothetical protein [Amniculibacterium aquaticum]